MDIENWCYALSILKILRKNIFFHIPFFSNVLPGYKYNLCAKKSTY